LLEHKADTAEVTGNQVKLVRIRNLRDNHHHILAAPYFVDATELGDLLPLTGTEYVTGAESKTETNELHAPEQADPKNNQAFTVCFAMDYAPGEDHTIAKPEEYDFWKEHEPELRQPWSG